MRILSHNFIQISLELRTFPFQLNSAQNLPRSEKWKTVKNTYKAERQGKGKRNFNRRWEDGERWRDGDGVWAVEREVRIYLIGEDSGKTDRSGEQTLLRNSNLEIYWNSGKCKPQARKTQPTTESSEVGLKALPLLPQLQLGNRHAMHLKGGDITKSTMI